MSVYWHFYSRAARAGHSSSPPGFVNVHSGYLHCCQPFLTSHISPAKPRSEVGRGLTWTHRSGSAPRKMKRKHRQEGTRRRGVRWMWWVADWHSPFHCSHWCTDLKETVGYSRRMCHMKSKSVKWRLVRCSCKHWHTFHLKLSIKWTSGFFCAH